MPENDMRDLCKFHKDERRLSRKINILTDHYTAYGTALLDRSGKNLYMLSYKVLNNFVQDWLEDSKITHGELVWLAKVLEKIVIEKCQSG